MHHSDHRLAEQNQSEQTESFGEVRGIRRHSEALTNRQPGRAEVERERDAPEHVPRRGRNQGGREPQRGRQSVPHQVPGRKQAGARHLARAKILKHEHEPQYGVGCGKTCRRPAVERVAGVRRHHCHAKHLQQRQAPLDAIVRVEPGREDGVSRPGPPNHDEEQGKPAEPLQRVIRAQRRCNLGNSRREHEIEEQLQPCHFAIGGLPGDVPELGGANEPGHFWRTDGQLVWARTMFPGMSCSHRSSTLLE